MVHRDPETGQFLPGHGDAWDDIEVATFRADVGVQAANMSGGTGFVGGDTDLFEGVELIDYDEFVDRNEELRLLSVSHSVSVYANSTETADGTVAASVEVSADPSLAVTGAGSVALNTDPIPPDNVVGNAAVNDSIDTIGRPLTAVGTGPFSDSATGVGGGGSVGEDSYRETVFPAEYGRFHPRDELFANGRFVAWNIDDAGIHLSLKGQHVYGVLAED